jgi:hypothetical protein
MRQVVGSKSIGPMLQVAAATAIELLRAVTRVAFEHFPEKWSRFSVRECDQIRKTRARPDT